jgi:hypothetical protein
VQVPDPGCKGSVLQDKAGSNMILSTPASCTGRVNQTIFLSKANGAPGSWVYRQFVAAESGYSTLAMTDEGTIANLFEEATCQFTLALVDPAAMIADGPVSLRIGVRRANSATDPAAVPNDARVVPSRAPRLTARPSTHRRHLPQ